jgi:hypothetical protein
MQQVRDNSLVGDTSQILYSTTDGRQRFPDILQVSYGEKAVIGFDRYGRALGAVVPMEAVLMLAGKDDRVDQGIRERIERAAQALLARINPISGRSYDVDDLESEVDSRRRSDGTIVSKKVKQQRAAR